MSDEPHQYPPILAGLRVLDLSHGYSGALAGSLLADLGASVTAVEHPKRPTLRTMLPRKEAESLWWKVIGRGKRAITLDLSTTRGRELLLRLAVDVDVIIENFRPGVLERWRLGPDDLADAGAELVMLRISGFGQTGPNRFRPGFGTVAEAMSGFAHLNGEPDGAPTFPSTTLADGVTGVFGAFGLLGALWGRRNGTDRPAVEVVDVALFEGLFRLIPTQVAAYDQLGEIPCRPGNKLTSHGVLRNLYRTQDGRYLCVSSVGPVAVRRILVAADATDLVAEVDADAMLRAPDRVVEFLDRCDVAVENWTRTHTFDHVCAAFDSADAVYQTVYDVSDIVTDPQYTARGDVIRVPDQTFGEIRMQGVVPKFSQRTHEVRAAGRPRGADNDEVYKQQLGLTAAEVDALRSQSVI